MVADDVKIKKKKKKTPLDSNNFFLPTAITNK